MLLSQVEAVLEGKILVHGKNASGGEIEVFTACGCDLMSDVLAFVKDQTLLLTGLINAQVIRTAEMMDIVAICFVRGKTPPEDVINLAEEKNIAILTTDLPMYKACGKLYNNGLGGNDCD